MMKHVLLTVMLLCFWGKGAYSQSFTVRDLINISSFSQQNIKTYMHKKGFVISFDYPDGDSIISYLKKRRKHQTDTLSGMMIDLFGNLHSRYFILKDLTQSEYFDNMAYLAKSAFVYDTSKNIMHDSTILFQKANMTIESTITKKDSLFEFAFTLKQRRIPDSIYYAEDLLQFDSQEFLSSYFGKKNVRNDLYYFSEKELQKCSVLFPGTDYQAVFVWKNESNLNDLSYIIVSNVIPTVGGEKTGVPDGNNAWKFKSGIQVGMSVKDVLNLNEMNFYIYGNKSELSFMAKPEKGGKINFKKTAIMFNCLNCFDNQMFNQDEVSALETAKAYMQLHIFDIVIYP